MSNSDTSTLISPSEIGFYWVKPSEFYNDAPIWEIAFYDGHVWKLCGEEMEISLEHIVEIKVPKLEPPI